MTDSIKPLDGITVIEIDSWMAAPSAAAILADLGADVVRRLCATADVFVCNLLPHRQAKYGMDPATLHGVNPTLVHATLTGYGTAGPQAWRPGYDVTAFFGRSGLYDSMRESAHDLVPQARPAQGDHTTGLALVATILAALRLVDKTGEGQVVETSLYETAAWTLASDFGVTAADGAPVRQRSRYQQITPLTNRYPCGDDHWVVFNMPEAPAFAKFCRAVGLDHLIDDERFDSVKARFVNMVELVDLIDEALSKKTRDEWGPIFDEHKIIWGPVLALDEVVADDQAEALGLFPTIAHPELGEYRTVRTPLRIHGVDTGPDAPSPRLGEHSRSVLAAAGLSADEIDTLVDSGAVIDAAD